VRGKRKKNERPDEIGQEEVEKNAIRSKKVSEAEFQSERKAFEYQNRNS